MKLLHFSELHHSNTVKSINRENLAEAKDLSLEIAKQHRSYGLLAIDCAPNGNLNAFYYNQAWNILHRLVQSKISDKLSLDKRLIEGFLHHSIPASFATDYKVGSRLGLWEVADIKKLDWENPFCVRHDNLSRIWHPNGKYFGHGQGLNGKQAIKDFVNEKTSYIQPFHNPLNLNDSEEGKKWKTIYRLFFWAERAQAQYLGGVWLSAPMMKVLPIKQAIMGRIAAQA